MKKIKIYISLLICACAFMFVFGATINAAPSNQQLSSNGQSIGSVLNTIAAADPSTCEGGNASACVASGKTGGLMKVFKLILNIMAGFVGLAAVIMLIVAGIQYSASNGDPQGVAAGENKNHQRINRFIGLYIFVRFFAMADTRRVD